LFPNAKIVPIALPTGKNFSAISNLKDELLNADLWYSAGHFELTEGHNLKLIKIPPIFFDAFHPDITYARHIDKTSFILPHYNSSIAVWAYNNGVNPKDTVKLYNSHTYSQIGYLYRWVVSFNRLKNLTLQFGIANRDFDNFFNKIKRRGCFMHSINHPNIFFISEFVKLLTSKVIKLDLDRPILIQDALLDNDIWPIYPEIGLHLGIKGSFNWRLNGREIDGLDNYINYIFESYQSQDIMPGQLFAQNNLDDFSNLFSARLDSL
jgi:hypothetical protein